MIQWLADGRRLPRGQSSYLATCSLTLSPSAVSNKTSTGYKGKNKTSFSVIFKDISSSFVPTNMIFYTASRRYSAYVPHGYHTGMTLAGSRNLHSGIRPPLGTTVIYKRIPTGLLFLGGHRKHHRWSQYVYSPMKHRSRFLGVWFHGFDFHNAREFPVPFPIKGKHKAWLKAVLSSVHLVAELSWYSSKVCVFG